MVTKHLKKFSTSWVSHSETDATTTTRLAGGQTNNGKWWRGCVAMWTLQWQEAGPHVLEQRVTASIKEGDTHTLWPRDSTPRYIPCRNGCLCAQNTNMRMCRGTLFVLSQNGKNQNVQELNQLWYMHSVAYTQSWKGAKYRHHSMDESYRKDWGKEAR